MKITTISSREFNQNTSRAKKAAQAGPVIITDRGRPAHVLLTFKEYKKMSCGRGAKIADLLAMLGIEEIELEIPQFRGIAQSADLS